MKRTIYFVGVLLLTSLTFNSCEDGGVNFFSLSQDIQFGEQMDSTILADPDEFPILDEAKNPEAYAFMNNMLADILASDYVNHAEDFPYKVRIIEKDVLNAFAVPGGYLYFYTGIMKYLDNSAQLAGVLAHEVAHIDRRHSTDQLTKQYGFSLLVSLLLGEDPSQMAEIAGALASGLAGLQFSRKDEYEADEFSIKYLSDTDFYPLGITGFFEKVQVEGHTSQTFEFLSTHPNDENRVATATEVWKDLGSPSGNLFVNEYAAFKALLP